MKNMMIVTPFGSSNLSIRVEISDGELTREMLAKVRTYLAIAERDIPPAPAEQTAMEAPDEE